MHISKITKADLSDQVTTLLSENENLKNMNEALVERNHYLSEKKDYFMECAIGPRERKLLIEEEEKRLYKLYGKASLTLREVADYIGIPYLELWELVERGSAVSFSYTYFPSSSKGDYVFVSLHDFAHFLVEYSV